MTLPQVAWDMLAGRQPELGPGCLQGGRLVIDIEHGEEANRLLLPGPGSDPHAHVLEAYRQILDRVIVVRGLIDGDDLPVGDQSSRLPSSLVRLAPRISGARAIANNVN